MRSGPIGATTTGALIPNRSQKRVFSISCSLDSAVKAPPDHLLHIMGIGTHSSAIKPSPPTSAVNSRDVKARSLNGATVHLPYSFSHRRLRKPDLRVITDWARSFFRLAADLDDRFPVGFAQYLAEGETP